MSREADLEKRIVAWCKAKGLYTRKFSSPSHKGVPDRIFVGPEGVLFLELKAPGKKPTALQQRELALINDQLNASVFAHWSDRYDEAIGLIESACL